MKIVASNLNLVGKMIDPNENESEAIDRLLAIINTEMESKGYNIRVSKTPETDIYAWEPDKKHDIKILLVGNKNDPHTKVAKALFGIDFLQ